MDTRTRAIGEQLAERPQPWVLDRLGTPRSSPEPCATTGSAAPESPGSTGKMRTAIPLTDDEQAAVDDGSAALDRLLERLTDTPTPGGPTPRQIGAPGQAALLPVIEVNRKPAR